MTLRLRHDGPKAQDLYNLREAPQNLVNHLDVEVEMVVKRLWNVGDR